VNNNKVVFGWTRVKTLMRNLLIRNTHNVLC